MLQTLKKGLLAGLKTTWTLGKIIFPVTLFITILQFTPVLPWIIKMISPLMSLFGLSGDAAIPIVLGNFLNLYAGIAGILSVDLTVKEVFIIAVMLSFAHNLFIESSVAIKVGVKVWVMILVRIGLAIISALIINLFWQGGYQLAQYGMIAPEQEHVTGVWPICSHAIEKAALGVYQLAKIVIPLMVGIQILKDLKLLKIFSRLMAPVTRMLGMKENTSTTLASGLLFGLAYGAGVMIQAVEEDGVGKKDVTLAFIFLCGCHAVVEDTLIFVPLGIPVIYLLLVRLLTAIILTFIVSFIWNRVKFSKNTPRTLEG
jgi:hypothetical protein